MADPWEAAPTVRRARASKQASAEPWNDAPTVRPPITATEVGEPETSSGTIYREHNGQSYPLISEESVEITPEKRAQLIADGYQKDDRGWFKVVGESAAIGDARAEMAQDDYLGAQVGDIDRSVGQGFTFGFQDELDALGAAGNVGIRNVFGRDLAGRSAPGYTAGEAFQARMAAEKQSREQFQEDAPALSFASNLAGGAVNPLTYAGGGYINAGRGAGQLARAGAVGGAYGGLASLGAADGNLAERAPEAALGTVLGGLGGAGVQAGTSALARRMSGIAGAGQRPVSPQRELSRQGIDLTPGQMIGGVAARGEDVAASIPGLGVRGARIRQTEQLNREVGRRTLAPLGEDLPENIPAGRPMVAHVQQRISDAYNSALSPVTVAPDAQFNAALQAARARLSGRAQEDFDTVIASTIGDRFTGPISGLDLKGVDADIGDAARMADGATGRAVARALNDVQDALDDVLGRTSPEALAGKTAADEAYANFVRLQTAAGGPGAKRGVFSANQLGSAVRRSDTTKRNGRFARGDALLQDLTDPATDVLPSQVPDSGTATRLLAIGGGGAAIGGSAALGALPQVVGTMIVSNAAYSRPVIRLLNAIYRATDDQGRQTALNRLAQAAEQRPEAKAAYLTLMQRLGEAVNDNATLPIQAAASEEEMQ